MQSKKVFLNFLIFWFREILLNSISFVFVFFLFFFSNNLNIILLFFVAIIVSKNFAIAILKTFFTEDLKNFVKINFDWKILNFFFFYKNIVSIFYLLQLRHLQQKNCWETTFSYCRKVCSSCFLIFVYNNYCEQKRSLLIYF